MADNVTVGSGTPTFAAKDVSGVHHPRQWTDRLFPTITFSLDTSAYANGDVLADTQILNSALRVTDGTGVIVSIVLNDEDDQGAAMDIVFLSANQSLGSENSAPSISDANARSNILGIVNIAAIDWIDFGGVRVAYKECAVPIKAVSGTDDIYVALISRGTPTQTASGITGVFGILQD